MKNFKLYILFFLVGHFACEQEEFPGSGLESLRDFTLDPIPGASIQLNSIKPDEDVVITWAQARSGFDSPVIYTVMLDEVDGDFSSPVVELPADDDGLATQISLTNAEFEALLDELGVEDLGSATYQWTVKATNGDITKVAEPATVTLNRFQDALAPFNLLTPANEATIELDYNNPTNIMTINWQASYSGLGNNVSYTLLFDEAGGDFTTPLISADVNENSTAFTHQQLDDILSSQGVADAEFFDLDWKVIASSGDLELESNVASLTIRRFNPIAVKYLVGAATPGGWGWTNPTEISEIRDGVFAGTLNFTNETFRTFETKDDWGSGKNYPTYISEGYTIDPRFENALDGDQNFRFIGTPGEYTFILNTVDKTITLTVGESKYLVGAATPGGWGWANPTELFQVENGVWKATLNFTNESFRFFNVKDDWNSGNNFPHFTGEGYTIDPRFENANDGDSNFRFIGTPGEYTITLDSNNKTITLD